MLATAIELFRGTYRFLSNFHPSRLRWRGRWWSTVEHAYQASKSDDPGEQEAIRMAGSPGLAKRMGRRVRMRTGFETEKFAIMEELVEAKFRHNDDLRRALLATGDRDLIEGNQHNDRIWGVVNGVGQNHLGKILMRVRARLAEEQREALNHSTSAHHDR